MSSILRPTPAQQTRRWIVLASSVFALVVPAVQTGLHLGLSQAEFAADSDATLRVAAPAFAIWGLIYLALAAYAVRQALPQTGESALITAFGWPSAVSLIGIGSWIVAAALDAELASIAIIFASLIALLIPLLAQSQRIRGLSLADRDRWLTVWPLGLLAGWLTVAAPVNLLTVVIGNGDLPTVLAPTAWAILAVLAVAAVALAVTWRIRMLAFALPVVWGLVGVFLGEQARNGTVAFSALIVAVAVLIGAVVLTLAERRRVERI